MIVPPDALAALQQHALAAYPFESCGLLVAGQYRACVNRSEDARKTFEISPQEIIDAGEDLQAVIHSHPDGPNFPSEEDMRGQMSTAVPWIIVPVYEDQCANLVIWGDPLPPAPLLGRTFVHGVADCYTLIRDTYRLGREACAAQDVDWPFESIELPEYARRDGWWSETTGEPQNFYVDCFQEAGFREITRDEVAPGDLFCKRIKSDRINHGGMILPGGLALHHLPSRLSRREPAAQWVNCADLFLRHTNAA